MELSNILALLGGLALFLFGMSLMGSALEKCAGNRLKTILTRLTSSKFNGFMLGVVVTAVIQSSSATTVMVVGFVNSGVMKLAQSVYIIMGANVGTAVTTWILSLMGISGDAWYITIFKPATFTPIMAFIGASMALISKKQKRKDTAGILMGFAILMFGMEMMSGAVEPLADMPSFTRFMTMFENPILGMLAGAILTALIQSSSASVGILQAISMTGGVSFATAIPIIMGQNIGTCITAMISSVGTTKDARRAAMVHLGFNVIGMVVFLTLYWAASSIFSFTFLSKAVTPLWIAIIHTLFKLSTTALLMPFGNQLVALAQKLVPDGKIEQGTLMLDERLFVTPSVALESAHESLIDMATTSFGALKTALNILGNFDSNAAQEIQYAENKVDVYEDKLGTYLVKLASHSMSEDGSHALSGYLHMIGDLERLSDHAVNLMESAQEIDEKKLEFPKQTRREVNVLIKAVREILDLSLTALCEQDLDKATQVEPLEQVIDQLNKEVRSRHIDRLAQAQSTIEIGFVLSDVISNLERVSDHCSNLAVCLLETARKGFDMHEYLNDVKSNQQEFTRCYNAFRQKFVLDAPQAE